MENDGDELFSTQALSFDSTLDSLMDVDYVPDEKALPFSPSSFNPPSEVLSAQKSLRADIGHNDGGNTEYNDTRNLSEPILEKEEEQRVNASKEQSKECTGIQENVKDTKSKNSDNEEIEKGNEKDVQINIDIKDRVRNDLREPSPNFDQIKAKRKKNLEKKSETRHANVKNTTENDKANRSNVRKCPLKHKMNAAEKRKSKSKNIEENIKEPPSKKMRISSKESNKSELTKKEHYSKCSDDSNEIRKVTENETEMEQKFLDKCPDRNEIKQENESIRSEQEPKDSAGVSLTVKKIDDPSVENMDSGQGKEALLKDNASNEIKHEANLSNKTYKQSSLDQENREILEDQTHNETEEENVVIAEGVTSNKVKMVIESEKEEREAEANNDLEDGRESDMNEGNDEEEEDEIENEKGDYDGDDDDEEFVDEDDIDDDEIHNWLEEGLTKEEIREKKREELKEGEFISSEKFVLKERGENPFEMLPAGWITLSHNCGMPVYLHKESRVCSFARPYHIGSGSSRNHEIPLSSIPCLQYRRELEREKIQEREMAEKKMKEANGDLAADENPTESSDKEILPKPIIKSAEDTDKIINLAAEEVHDYCRGLFDFKILTVKKFKTWREKRAHLMEEKKNKAACVPSLAPETKLITCPIPPEYTSKKTRKKEFVLNPEGKTAVSILHEYTQNVLRVQPTYEFREMSNADYPFQATVLLNGMQYGSGVASGKRQAKNEGAKATLEILVPELAEMWNEKNPTNKQKNELNTDLKFFETVAIEDPRVPELCVKSSLPQPYQVLHTCLQRNYGLGDTTFKVDKKMISNQKTEFTLSVGKRTCTVVCKNKREAKQKAAQSMLQQLHPLLKNWAAILRLYSRNTEVGFDERKDEFPEPINSHQEKKKNIEILGKLKNAMKKVREQRKNFSDGNSASGSAQQPKTLNL